MRGLAALAGLALMLLAVVLAVRGKVWAIRTEALTLDSEGATLAATLALPRRHEPPFPAAVVVHGSGPTGRRELWHYVRRLVPRGLALLIYDKRGVGRSTGVYRRIGVADSEQELGLLAADAAAALDYLEHRDEIDPGRIGLIGGSQAGWVMPLGRRAPRQGGVPRRRLGSGGQLRTGDPLQSADRGRSRAREGEAAFRRGDRARQACLRRATRLRPGSGARRSRRAVAVAARRTRPQRPHGVGAWPTSSGCAPSTAAT